MDRETSRPRDEAQGTIDLAEVFVASAKAFARLFLFFVAASLTPVVLVSAFSCCFCVVGALIVGVVDPANSRDDGRVFGGILIVVALVLLVMLSVIQIAMQTRAVTDLERGQKTSFSDALRALPTVLKAFAPVGLAFGFAYALGTMLCVLPGVLVSGFFGLVPVAAAVDEAAPSDAFTRGRELASRLGVLAFVPSAIHAVAQLMLLVAFGAIAAFLDARGEDLIGVIVAVEAVFAILGWVLFTYFAVVIPAVIYARLAPRPAEDVEGLADVFR